MEGGWEMKVQYDSLLSKNDTFLLRNKVMIPIKNIATSELM